MVDGHPRISIDPGIMVGQPCIIGTRITVKHIINELGVGMSAAEIVEQYPRLSVEDVQAACAHAVQWLPKSTLESTLMEADNALDTR